MVYEYNWYLNRYLSYPANAFYDVKLKNASYIETKETRVLNQISKDIKRKASIDFLPTAVFTATYVLKENYPKNSSSFKVHFAWNVNNTYVIITGSENKTSIVIVGYFKYCSFKFHLTKKEMVHVMPSSCRKTGKYSF